MPIKGVTEVRRVPRLGKIHLGEKVTNAGGAEYPRATNHFVVPPEVAAVYGETPTALDVLFPLDDVEKVASQFYRVYSQTRGLVCRGDGETAIRLISDDDRPEGAAPSIAGRDAQSVVWESVACAGRECAYYQGESCRELMMLQFVLPRVPGLGIWQLDTSSYHSIVNINSTLDMVGSMFGTIVGVPLILSLEPMEVAPDGKKKTIRVLKLGSDKTFEALMAGRQSPEPLALPAAEDETPTMLYPTPEERQAQEEADQVEEEAPTTAPEERAGALQLRHVGDLMTHAIKPVAQGGLGYKDSAEVCRTLAVRQPAKVLDHYESLEAARDALVLAKRQEG